jgi:hypothetical protein
MKTLVQLYEMYFNFISNVEEGEIPKEIENLILDEMMKIWKLMSDDERKQSSDYCFNFKKD